MASAARIRRALFVLYTIGFVVILFSLELGYSYSYWKNRTRSCSHGALLYSSQRQGYLSTNYDCGLRSRLGNQLLELLAVIGIAEKLNRIPYIKVENEFMLRKVGDSIRELFPMIQRQFSIVYWNVTEKIVPFHNGSCCIYDDVNRLKDETEEYLQLEGTYFQSHKYFDHRRDDVREWLLPNETVQCQAIANFPIDFEDHFLVCVHIRREDFVISDLKDPSEANFSVNALKYLMDKYSRRNKLVGAVILGNELEWERETFGGIPRVHVMENSSAAEDFAFSRLYCDAVLITAPSSTFGFFLGYLSKDFNVYYRDILTTKDMTQKQMKQSDFFPSTWTKIRETNGHIEEIFDAL